MGMIIVLLCGAVLGTSIQFTAVPLSAATATAAAASTTSVFGWCAVPGGLCNPFSLFSLFTLILYFFSFLSRPFFGVLGRFWGYLGARDAPLRVLGLFGRTRRQKPPHQVNLDAFREKIFSVQGVLKIERGTQNQAAGIFPLGMVAQFISNVGVKTSLLARRDETPANIKQRSTTKILTIYAV